MNRALMAATLAAPSLAFACGGGQGLGDSVIGSVLLLLLFKPLGALVALGVVGALGGAMVLSIASAARRPGA